MPSSRSRAEILGAIAAIPHAVQGKICEMRKKLAGGKTATYYNLQYWSDGKNHSIHVPREKLAEFKEAVEGGRKLRSLVTELGERDAQDILTSEPALKKKSSRSPAARRSWAWKCWCWTTAGSESAIRTTARWATGWSTLKSCPAA